MMNYIPLSRWKYTCVPHQPYVDLSPGLIERQCDLMFPDGHLSPTNGKLEHRVGNTGAQIISLKRDCGSLEPLCAVSSSKSLMQMNLKFPKELPSSLLSSNHLPILKQKSCDTHTCKHTYAHTHRESVLLWKEVTIVTGCSQQQSELIKMIWLAIL